MPPAPKCRDVRSSAQQQPVCLQFAREGGIRAQSARFGFNSHRKELGKKAPVMCSWPPAPTLALDNGNLPAAAPKQPLTQFGEDVLLLPEDEPVGLVGGSLVVVLQGEEVKQLGRTELVSPLVGSRTETGGKTARDKTISSLNKGPQQRYTRGLCWGRCSQLRPCAHLDLLVNGAACPTPCSAPAHRVGVPQ